MGGVNDSVVIAAFWFDMCLVVGCRYIAEVAGAHVFVSSGPAVLQVGLDALWAPCFAGWSTP